MNIQFISEQQCLCRQENFERLVRIERGGMSDDVVVMWVRRRGITGDMGVFWCGKALYCREYGSGHVG